MKRVMYALLSVFLFFSGCSKSIEDQIIKYLEFYYPTSGEITYNLEFEWGEYGVFTGAKMATEVHPDSEPFKGYITYRPFITDKTKAGTVFAYLVTPNGEVWKTSQWESIPARTTRQEIVKKKTNFGTSTQTKTIESFSEPIILSFKNNKQIWKKFGTLTVEGTTSSFTPAK